jgi:tetratricopeptide (TPR) repeat protein
MNQSSKSMVLKENYTISAALLGPENPLPMFREREENKKYTADDSFDERERKYFGFQTGHRVLPYRMQSNYTRNRKIHEFKAVVLENHLLKALFLPEMGGRLVSLFDKGKNQELLFKNPIFQPANLANRDAWFAGGIEWNVGQYGHAFHTCSSVFCAKIKNSEGKEGVRLFDFARCKQLFWQVDFFLHDTKPFLISHVKVINPYQHETSMYWWTNIAVPEKKDVRVLAPTNRCIYTKPNWSGFAASEVPYIPSLNGKDASYSLNSPFANEFFFQILDRKVIWETAVDKNGLGFIDISTNPLNYRKLFCWGNHRGGQRWQEYLSGPNQAYIEIQGGLVPTQLHGLPMPPKMEMEWTQVFGPISVNPEKAHSEDWNIAIEEIDDFVTKTLSERELYEINSDLTMSANSQPQEILHGASGWGYLELLKMKSLNHDRSQLESFTFPESSCEIDQKKWIQLLKEKTFPTQDPQINPGDWMIDSKFKQMLGYYLSNSKEDNWYAWLHLGIMELEMFNPIEAKKCWEKSLSITPSCWAYRNLAQLRIFDGNLKEAQVLMEKGLPLLPLLEENIPYIIEYFMVLIQNSKLNELIQVFTELPKHIQGHERLQLYYAQAKLEKNDLAEIERIFDIEFANIREGEVLLTDLWYGYWGRKIALEKGEQFQSAHIEAAKKEYPIPQRINYNMS